MRDSDGVWVVKPEFESIERAFEGAFIAKKDGRYGIINGEGRWLISPLYEYIGPFFNDIALVLLNDKYGYINSKGKYIFPPILDEAEQFFKYDVARVIENGLRGYINRKGEWVIRPKTYENPILIDIQTKLLDFGESFKYRYGEGFYTFPWYDKWGYGDYRGSCVIAPIYTFAHPFSNGEARVILNGKTGIINPEGEWLREIDIGEEGRG